MDPLRQLGINKREKADIPQALFDFLQECHISPFPEEYEVIPIYDENDKIIKFKVKKFGMPIDLLQMLLEKVRKYKEEVAKSIPKGKKW